MRQHRGLPAFSCLFALLVCLSTGATGSQLRRIPGRGVERIIGPLPIQKVCIPSAVGGDALLMGAGAEGSEAQAFESQLRRGSRAASEKGLVMAGLLRNVAPSIAHLFDALHKTGDLFARYHIIVLENNSEDKTEEHLQSECRGSSKITCLIPDLPELGGPQTLDTFGQAKPHRIEHLTMLRQLLLNEVRSFVQGSDQRWDFVLSFDGDAFDVGAAKSLQQGFSPASILAVLGYRNNTDGPLLADDPPDLVCANSMRSNPRAGRYRDVFALRQDAWDEPVHTGKVSADPKNAVFFSGNEPVPVLSCFSGLAMYSMRALKESMCQYTFEREDLCEHVVFNRCLSDKGFGRAVIYPAWAMALDRHRHVCRNIPL